jgi:NAD(P)-dependent dehydrogenase (short-subunit alcohol dehydrogenase family)
MNTNLLTKQVAIVNGAGRGPGPLLVETLARAGATVAAIDVSPILLDPLVARVRAAGGQIRTYIGDVSRGMPARALMDEVLTDWERVDVLVNNPRVAPDVPLLKMDEWDWHHTLEVNLSGPFLLTQFAARLMVEQGGGVILNLLATESPALHASGRAAYAVTQAGLLAFSQSAAHELIAYNIRIYALCLDDAALQSFTTPDSALPGSLTNSLSELAVFLCSPAASHLPGQVFRVEGNRHGLHQPARPESQQE